MTDRELLELAAKAAGVNASFDRARRDWSWNPLDDDGDALRLGMHLGMSISIREARADGGAIHFIGIENDRMEATRRAIVRAAAEIGRTEK